MLLLAGVIAAPVRPPAPLVAQAPASVTFRVAGVSLSPDTVPIGDRFDVRLSIIVPEGMVLFLPDSLEGSGFEPFGPVEWSEVDAAAGRTVLSVTYPLLAFDLGSIAVPEFEVFAARRNESEAAGLSTPGALLGSWDAFRQAPASAPSARLASVPEQRVWVATVLALDDLTQQLAPRPAADVWGGDRQWAASVLVVVFALALAAIAAASVRAWRASAGVGGGRGTPEVAPRSGALIALDELLATGLHVDGRTKEFFTRSSMIVRDYVETFDSDWDRAWTGSELMSALAATMDAGACDILVTEMRLAEAVKFGGCRPDAGMAEAHWRAVRDWIEATPAPEAPGSGAA
jgi:hypothetical protein